MQEGWLTGRNLRVTPAVFSAMSYLAWLVVFKRFFFSNLVVWVGGGRVEPARRSGGVGGGMYFQNIVADWLPYMRILETYCTGWVEHLPAL